MSDDWDTVTKIGSRAGGGGGGPRATTVKSKSQLNAAQRSGAILSTEKKYASANTSNKAAASTGQFLTKVDRSDDIVKPKVGDSDLGKFVAAKRNELLKMDQKKFATLLNIPQKVLIEYEQGKVPIPQGDTAKIERALGIFIKGSQKGEPKPARGAAKKGPTTEKK